MRLLILLPILIAGIFLRFFSLSNLPNGLHWDEMDTGYQAWSLWSTGKDYFGNVMPIFPHSLADWRTPVFIYSAVPFVKALGLTALAVRLPSAIFGLLSIVLIYILATRLLNWRVGALAAISLSVSIWAVQYSRQSVETISLMTYTLVAVNLFYRGLNKPKSLILSALFFALATACYAPGKLFIPLFVLSLIVIHFKVLLRISKKYLITSFVVLGIVSAPIYWLSLLGPAGARFHDVSIFTDPTLATEINYKRLYSEIAGGTPLAPGMQPRLVDKFIFNKPFVLASTFVNNYLEAFSTDFLFTKGDTELRHSPSKDLIGMLFWTDAVALVFGLIFVRKPEVWAWLLLAPVSAALTRDGGAHAARSLIMLPALTLFIAAGVERIYHLNKKAWLMFTLLFAVNVLWVYSYYFNTYRAESARPFMWGFDKLVTLAQQKSPEYDKVFVDLHQDTLLMAYLFYAHIDPKVVQALQPLPTTNMYGMVNTINFGNIYLAYPGDRSWYQVWSSKVYKGHSFIIADFTAPQLSFFLDKQEMDYPDTTPAFYTFSIFK